MISNREKAVEQTNINYYPNGEDDQDAEEVAVKEMTDKMTPDELTQERNGDEPF